MRLVFALILAAASSLHGAAPLLFIDPGHGAGEPGVHDGALNEADIVLDIATQLGALLKARGVDTVMSHGASDDPAPSARVAAANASGASAFLSLHVNHSSLPSVRGPRIFIPKPLAALAKGEPRRWDQAAGQRSEEAKALAEELAKSLNQSEAVRVNVQALNLVVFKGLAIPGVVVELGYLSHAESRARFADPEYRKTVAGRLAEAVIAWGHPASLSTTAGVKP